MEAILCYDGATGKSLEAVVSNLSGPRGITFGPDGSMYVSDEWANDVRRYDFATGTLKTFVPSGSGNLFQPHGLTFGPGGDLYVVSKFNAHGTITYGSYRVMHYDRATGEYLSTMYDSGRTDKSEASGPVVFGPDNNLYVGWGGYATPMTQSGTFAPSCMEEFAGPLTPTTNTQLPVTVLKTYQKTYTNSKSLGIPENGNNATSTITVPNAGTIVDVNLKFNITHPNDSDLSGWLASPNSVVSTLFGRIGGSGDNFTNTVLDDEAPSGIFIDNASAPFTGIYRTQSALANFDGGPSNGTWTLSLSDSVKGNKGTLNNWSITVIYGIGPTAPPGSGRLNASTSRCLARCDRAYRRPQGGDDGTDGERSAGQQAGRRSIRQQQ